MSDIEALAIQQTRRWLERIVIGLNLCPFAAAPYQRDAVLFRVCDGAGQDLVFQAFLETLQDLWEREPHEAETALLVVTSALADFDDYLDALYSCERAVVDAGLEGWIQVASFHPDYRFDGSDENDPANFTNRSPYPMFHLIRELELEQALASYRQPDAIPERNIRRLRTLGIDGIRKLLDPD